MDKETKRGLALGVLINRRNVLQKDYNENTCSTKKDCPMFDEMFVEITRLQECINWLRDDV